MTRLPLQRSTPLLLSLLLLAACSPEPGVDRLPHSEVMDIAKTISSDEMAGRAPGTAGSALAREYLLDKVKAIGVRPFDNRLSHRFPRSRTTESGETEQLADGINIVFELAGSRADARTIVVTAHYDHLGVIDGEIYNGADDNASGVAGLLAIAKHFRESPPNNRIIFALLDAEESGFTGARAFVANYDTQTDIHLNINLDMLSRSDVNELYVAGTYHYPQFVPLFTELADRAPVNLLMGHDDPALGPSDDWTQLSDHFAFFEKGIPFMYFGVEDHPDYHQPTDDFERIPLDFFSRSIETVVLAAEAIDNEAHELFPGTRTDLKSH